MTDPHPPKASREERRKELLDAADVVIRKDGPDASMISIAAAAGITKPILYRHFGDKGGMYRALAERYIGPLLAGVRTVMAESANPGDKVHATIDSYLRFIEANRPVYQFLMHRAQMEDPAAESAVATTIRRLGEEVGAALHDTAPTIDDPIAAAALGHGIVGMVHVAGDWWLEDPKLSREQLTAHLAALVLGGLEGFG